MTLVCTKTLRACGIALGRNAAEVTDLRLVTISSCPLRSSSTRRRNCNARGTQCKSLPVQLFTIWVGASCMYVSVLLMPLTADDFSIAYEMGFSLGGDDGSCALGCCSCMPCLAARHKRVVLIETWHLRPSCRLQTQLFHVCQFGGCME